MSSATTTSPNPTALERHASFFDPTGTGFVTCKQTFEGMRRLGVHLRWRVLLTPVIGGFLGTLTQGHPSLRIKIATIAQGKHPYDSGSFDAAGNFDSGAFDALFARAGDVITAKEMRGVITARGNRLPAMGKIAGALGHWFSSREVEVFFCVAADATKMVDGKKVAAVTKKTFQSFYDGTLFFDIARRRALVDAGCVRARST